MVRRAAAWARRGLARRTARVTGPRLSVVVLVRGRAEFLDECVRSILASSYRSLEVLLVADPEDPSATAGLAGLAGLRDDARRVRRVAVAQGSPLDQAVAAATGDYLAFVDADDRVPGQAYQRLVSSLEASGGDLAMGAERRSTRPPGRPPWVARVQDEQGARQGLTAGTCPQALVDLSLTNKVFRLSWWRAAGIAVGSRDGAEEGMASALLAARTFDLVVGTVYERHRRDVALPLPEQRRFRADLVAERCRAVSRAGGLVAAAEPAAYREWLVEVLRHLLPPLYVDAVGGGEDYLAALRPLVSALLADASTSETARVGLGPRLGAWVAANGTLTDVALLQAHLADNATGVPVTGGLADLPCGLSVLPPDAMRRVEDVDRVLRVRVGDAVRAGGLLRVDVIAFVEYVEPATLPSVTIQGVPAQVAPHPDRRANDWAARAFEDRSGADFVATVPLADLPERPGRWRTQVTVAGRTELLVAEERHPAGVVDVVLTSVEVHGDALLLAGVSAHPLSRLRFVGGRGETEATAVDGRDGTFSARVPLCTGLFGERVGLPYGRYRVEPESAGVALNAAWSAELLADPPELIEDRLGLRLAPGGRGAEVVVGAPLGADERSAFGQRQWRAAYQAVPRAAYDRTVLLETFRGRGVGDNPGAVARELIARDLGLEIAWVVDDPSVAVPAGTRAVPRRTHEWYDLLANARVYVSNAGAPDFFTKKPGQLHLQTWHGTPLKRIGEDRGPGDLTTWRHRRRIAHQAAGWDAMVLPSPYCAPIFRSAFSFEGSFLESGYPRNDLLLSPGAPAVRERVRDRLGLTGSDNVVLYAPTWREYLGVRDAKPLYLDAERLVRRLPDAVVLVRGHYNATGHKDVFREHPRIHDVTRYPDIADLYLAADALVTDYSSVMFDFALTDKPMVLLVPDLEQYRDVERGFYFDLAARAPGPLVDSTEAVVEVLSGPDAHAPARAGFRAEFCPWDDGHAAARLVDFLLAAGLASGGDPRTQQPG